MPSLSSPSPLIIPSVSSIEILKCPAFKLQNQNKSNTPQHEKNFFKKTVPISETPINTHPSLTQNPLCHGTRSVSSASLERTLCPMCESPLRSDGGSPQGGSPNIPDLRFLPGCRDLRAFFLPFVVRFPRGIPKKLSIYTEIVT